MRSGPAELGGSGSDRLSIRVHEIVIAPRNLVVSTLLLSLRVEFLTFNFIGAEVRKVHEGLDKLREGASSRE